jgi:hypothetical protein
VTLGDFTGRVWRHVHRDGDGTRLEFDVTIDGLVDASSSGLGSDPQRLRQLASVALATADELGEARARQWHPAGRGLTSAYRFTDKRSPRPEVLGGGSVMSLSPGVACRSGPTRPT